VIVVDTGPVVAAGNRRDHHNKICKRLLTTYPGPLPLPEPLITEIAYMLAGRAGTAAELDFLRDTIHGSYEVVPLDRADRVRVAELVEKYASLPLGTADACVVAIAERYKVPTLATLDRRHFSIVQPRGIGPFTLLPDLDE
jgi:uncharacterized protein